MVKKFGSSLNPLYITNSSNNPFTFWVDAWNIFSFYLEFFCSLLGLAGGNKRTANVRSKGYSNLFTLSKVDFERAMVDYPETYARLKKKAQWVWQIRLNQLHCSCAATPGYVPSSLPYFKQKAAESPNKDRKWCWRIWYRRCEHHIWQQTKNTQITHYYCSGTHLLFWTVDKYIHH